MRKFIEQKSIICRRATLSKRSLLMTTMNVSENVPLSVDQLSELYVA